MIKSCLLPREFSVSTSLVTAVFLCFSEESKKRGFTVILDSRDGSWSNMVTVLGCLKVSLNYISPKNECSLGSLCHYL